MKSSNRFQKGSGVFTCKCCKRQTRDTGDSNTDLRHCHECYELAGIENSYLDGCAEPSYLDTARHLLKQCQQRGGQITTADFPNIPF